MAEDVLLCKRGHPRTDNPHQCPTCHRESQARYRANGGHQAVQARYEATEKGRATSARYRATAKRWLVIRKNELKGRREAIAAQLEALKREEEECRTLLARLMPTK